MCYTVGLCNVLYYIECFITVLIMWPTRQACVPIPIYIYIYIYIHDTFDKNIVCNINFFIFYLLIIVTFFSFIDTMKMFYENMKFRGISCV